ncbi:MAG: hypothetical protein MN733_41530 [Nitrososphaera sp.]|nr:hypothetical protein [Nitrososphaera sp.]
MKNDKKGPLSDRKSIKEAAWERKRHVVNHLADRLGHPVDEGIKETVVALLVYRFPTTASCEGHLDWGLPYPWVEVRTPEPKGRRRSKAKLQQWRLANLGQQRKMIGLMSQFYDGRDAAFDARLICSSTAFGDFRIQSMGCELIHLLSSRKKRGKLELYRKGY